MGTAKIIKTGSSWNYYRDDPNRSAVGGINYLIRSSKSFDHKTSITGRLEGHSTVKEVDIVVLLKHLSNFWRTLGTPLINCEINLSLAWSKSNVITGKSTREDDSDDPDAIPAVAAVNNPTNTIFNIKNSNLCVPVATLSTEVDNKLLEQLKTGFKRTIKWNK